MSRRFKSKRTAPSRKLSFDYPIHIDEFVEWYCSEPRLSFSRTVVLRYRIHLESRHLAPATDLPGPSMAKTCSRPFGELLKIHTFRRSMTHNPGQVSPSEKIN